MKASLLTLLLVIAAIPGALAGQSQSGRQERLDAAMRLLDDGQAREALPEFSKLYKESKGSCLDCLLGKASAQVQMGRFLEAEKTAKRAVAATDDPQTLIVAYTLMGFSHYLRLPPNLVAFAGASRSVEPFRKAYELDGGVTESVRWNLATALEFTNRVEEARQLFNDGVSTAEPAADDTAARPSVISGGIVRPNKVRDVEPQYSAQARLAGIQGKVILRAVVDERGSVGDIEVVQGLKGCTADAIHAVRNWQYEPTTLDGRPAAILLDIEVPFAPALFPDNRLSPSARRRGETTNSN